ncbi:L-dopachrome tautomerase-related protein [Limibacter armeniacum]|uniref:L-dopachrome tautomerase-related protein n=1 Tax=Limibacter armeniacum TaxID=466084 RepID=UPI002FE52719
MKINVIHFLLSLLLLFVTGQFSAYGQPENAEVYAITREAVGDIAFTAKGELVVSYHPFFNPEIRVAKVISGTDTKPFPNLAWNTPCEDSDRFLSAVSAVRTDANGVVWMLDMGTANNIAPKMVGWDTKNDKLFKVYNIPDQVCLKTSQFDDFVVDLLHGVFIIADVGIASEGDGSQAGLVVLDMQTGQSRRVLEGHYTTTPEEVPLLYKQKHLSRNGKPILVGVDGITADRKNEWLYFAPLNGRQVYRMKIAALIDPNLSIQQMEAGIEVYAAKPNNSGLSIDRQNNLYLTNPENASVDIIFQSDKSVDQYAINELLDWPTSLSFNANDGYMYISDAQLHLGATFNEGKDRTTSPFYIFRVKPLAKGIEGR